LGCWFFFFFWKLEEARRRGKPQAAYGVGQLWGRFVGGRPAGLATAGACSTAPARRGCQDAAGVALTFSPLAQEFFTPPDSFDAVQHMLECLPDEVSEAFIESQAAQTQLVLEAVNSKLSARVMRSYGAFVHGMAQVQQLKSDLTLTAIQCRSARKHLGRVRTETVEPGLTILAKLRRKRALAGLLRMVVGVKALQSDSLEVASRLRAAAAGGKGKPPPPQLDLLRCAELQRSCERRLASLSRLKPVKRMEARVANAAEALHDAMHAELRRASAEFDEATYAAAIGCALELDRIDELVNRVHVNFAEAIKCSTKEVLHNHVLLSLGTVTDAQVRRPLLPGPGACCSQLRASGALQPCCCAQPVCPALPAGGFYRARKVQGRLRHAARGVLRLVPRAELHGE